MICDETGSCWLENIGNGKFVKRYLPMEAQFAPVNAIVCVDIDGDGMIDLLLAGNEYQTEVMTGRYDASYGCYLRGRKISSLKLFSRP
ncbi:VCBS repeat-containing protein [Paraflavitalea speifideaquila]|uniref:FG-GAP repeat domain-containing protein n=1 Tax=Paraflavitalea speifideaquila TaxID=3076558 RepID=UPI0028E877F7|nr:VCBS repeat-containing protein [Paraflavitalea speifideiaquila]